MKRLIFVLPVLVLLVLGSCTLPMRTTQTPTAMPLITEAPAGGDVAPVETAAPVVSEAGAGRDGSTTRCGRDCRSDPSPACRCRTHRSPASHASRAANGFPTASHPGGACSYHRLRRYLRPEHDFRRANL